MATTEDKKIQIAKKAMDFMLNVTNENFIEQFEKLTKGDTEIQFRIGCVCLAFLSYIMGKGISEPFDLEVSELENIQEIGYRNYLGDLDAKISKEPGSEYYQFSTYCQIVVKLMACGHFFDGLNIEFNKGKTYQGRYTSIETALYLNDLRANHNYLRLIEKTLMVDAKYFSKNLDTTREHVDNDGKENYQFSEVIKLFIDSKFENIKNYSIEILKTVYKAVKDDYKDLAKLEEQIKAYNDNFTPQSEIDFFAQKYGELNKDTVFAGGFAFEFLNYLSQNKLPRDKRGFDTETYKVADKVLDNYKGKYKYKGDETSYLLYESMGWLARGEYIKGVDAPLKCRFRLDDETRKVQKLPYIHTALAKRPIIITKKGLNLVNQLKELKKALDEQEIAVKDCKKTSEEYKAFVKARDEFCFNTINKIFKDSVDAYKKGFLGFKF